MDLTHIPLENLSVSALNMRHGKRAPDVSDLLPSVRQRGILMPLLVRPNGAPDSFEIVAGRRRYFAARALADECGTAAPLPCHVMTEGDDAEALEASLIENVQRQDPDLMTQYETFVKLIRSGKTESDIAATFGLSERQVSSAWRSATCCPRSGRRSGARTWTRIPSATSPWRPRRSSATGSPCSRTNRRARRTAIS